ncbi:MAG: hypothetical protein DWQ47_13725 [Acidobacteria bacterium]|nr:MAG: hypothetical protein DWQ32_01125 [Acidobacteriota bacterium]REK02867.1 MAG: hypothetical protein DWQ38_11010 [Acidobacteriota bacterium]REK13329.1 MAG: hypothetical protein DWQ43_06815 [Acidobacteriota bacterium]REK41323.1 MAG: hypothetical protein DWQ47_13725 [Acidobacteriota bacterium]
MFFSIKYFAIALLLLPAALMAQTGSSDLATLRDKAGLQSDSVILIVSGGAFPKGSTLRIFSAIRTGGNRSGKFESWLDRWNQKEGPDHGFLDRVSTPEESDLLVVQFRTAASAYVSESAIRVGNIDREGRPSDDWKVESEAGIRRLELPVRTYILIRKAGIWHLVFHHTEDGRSEKRFRDPEIVLRNEIKKRMKDR